MTGTSSKYHQRVFHPPTITSSVLFLLLIPLPAEVLLYFFSVLEEASLAMGGAQTAAAVSLQPRQSGIVYKDVSGGDRCNLTVNMAG